MTATPTVVSSFNARDFYGRDVTVALNDGTQVTGHLVSFGITVVTLAGRRVFNLSDIASVTAA